MYPSQQELELHLHPIIPLVLQVFGGLGMLVLFWLLWWLNPRTIHSRPVNSVRLAASGTTVLSASSDQTMRRWRVNRLPWLIDRRRLIHEGAIETADEQPEKSIRVLRQLPNELRQVAAGLESGEVQLWQVDPPRLLYSFFEQGQPDRVFGLGITQDSRYLFSGHGSGRVRQWDLALKKETPVNKLDLILPDRKRRPAIASIALHEVVNHPSLVAIVGQYNQLVLWDVDHSKAHPIAYDWVNRELMSFPPVLNQNSYLTSVTVANDKFLMATADNEGFISLWDLRQLRLCMGDASRQEQSFTQATYTDDYGNKIVPIDCKAAILSQWQAGGSGAAIRDVSLSENGCYLASTGDDGRVLLWSVASNGKLLKERQPIQVNSETKERLNSVDIQLTNDNVVLIASDAPNNRVELYRKQVKNHGCE